MLDAPMSSLEIPPKSTILSGKLVVSALLYFSLAMALSLAVFFSGLDNYFFGDDWWMLDNYHSLTQAMLQDVFGTGGAWFRPVYTLYVTLCWWLFGLNPTGYHLASVLIYAWVAGLVGLLLEIITKDRRIGTLAVILFSVFATHAEPVLWFSANNELLAALFTLIGVISYILGRESKRPALFVMAGASALLAFASKETALFFPIPLAVYDLMLFWETEPKARRATFFIPLVSIVLLWIAYLLFRIPIGSSNLHVITITPYRIATNLVYYALVGLFLLPNNYAFFSSLSLWRTSPILPVATLTLAAAVYIIVGVLWWRHGLLRHQRYRRSLLFTSAWALAAIGPVIPIVAERLTFASSIGIVATTAILLIGAWDAAQKHGRGWKAVMALVIATYIALNVTVLTYRSGWFGKAAALNRVVLEQIAQFAADHPDSRIVIANLPAFTGHAPTFTSPFPYATNVLQLPVDVIAVFDHELTGKSAAEQEEYIRQAAQKANTEIIFWYQDGTLWRRSPTP